MQARAWIDRVGRWMNGNNPRDASTDHPHPHPFPASHLRAVKPALRGFGGRRLTNTSYTYMYVELHYLVRLQRRAHARDACAVFCVDVVCRWIDVDALFTWCVVRLLREDR